MYPFSSTNGTNSFFSPYGTTDSKTPHEPYYPPSSSSFHLQSPYYIPLEDEAAIFNEFFEQQLLFADDHNCHNSFVDAAQEQSTGVQSIMEKCLNSNGQIATRDGDVNDDYYFNTNMELENSSIPTKRSSKKDRHSKINTAQGPRDRRMRLSRDVAKELFGLQDLLGFDKASKAVEWLLTKSETAIQELLQHQICSFMDVSNSASSTSECEVLSGTNDQCIVKTGDDQVTTKGKPRSCSESSRKEKQKVARGVRRSANLHHPLAKETRERARARARERAMEKRINKLASGQDSKFRPCLDQDVNRLGSLNPIEDNQVQAMEQPKQPSSHFQFKQAIVSDEYSSLMTGNWSPSYFFNYQHNSGYP